MSNQQQTAYLAPLGFERPLIDELKHIKSVHGRLVLADGPVQRAYWANNIWFNPQTIPIRSITHAAQTLRAIQRNWWPYALAYPGRMRLIQENLPYISPKPLTFLQEIPAAPLGSWTLVDENTLLCSPHCSSPVPHGEWTFQEDKVNPPSRAYLKLWEFFTRFRVYPSKKDICLDLGASPGGWTFVLANLARKVFAIDRSELDERLQSYQNITFSSGDAFKVDLSNFPEASWIFSDVVCFPDKLYEFVAQLLDQYPDKKYVFSVKFQGDNHKDMAPQFAALPGQLVHLSQNKHELTWFKL